ncbi:hypothetical protein J2752_001639 [Halarchaeum rubridurum]|uniref:Uncharacterized protein n=1 Tax=Halarchaeum rubridurum TaxID=489911 RepID=A0A8T4GSC4_9EURY|nr:hypothetical protein [Halarchaeum rubridurum]
MNAVFEGPDALDFGLDVVADFDRFRRGGAVPANQHKS